MEGGCRQAHLYCFFVKNSKALYSTYGTIDTAVMYKVVHCLLLHSIGTGCWASNSPEVHRRIKSSHTSAKLFCFFLTKVTYKFQKMSFSDLDLTYEQNFFSKFKVVSEIIFVKKEVSRLLHNWSNFRSFWRRFFLTNRSKCYSSLIKEIICALTAVVFL